jgi:hypothetical protein
MQHLATTTLLLITASTQAAGIIGQGTWETTLLARDVNSDSIIDAYYDTTLDITWLADAGYAQTSGYDDDNRMTWDEAQIWIGTLNASTYLGVTDWRLPQVFDSGLAGCDFSVGGTDCGWNVDTRTGEMASLFYDTLDNRSFFDTDGNLLQDNSSPRNTGPFLNMPSFYTWADTESATNAGEAWYFHLGAGTQNDADMTLERATWAVRSGDIAASVIPIPATFWLFASALAGLGWLRGRRNRSGLG